MKMTYAEQLRHPNWQRVRLQVLEKADFKCCICGNDEMTLHVHHKQYIKGRMAWEYDLSNFDALCEACHESTHKAKDSINALLACIPSVRWQEVSDMLAGWAEGWLGVDKVDVESPHAYEIGKLAGMLEFAISHGTAVAVQEQLLKWDRNESLHLVLEKHWSPWDEEK